MLFVPSMKYNLLSIPKTTQAGMRVQFHQYGCEIINASSEEFVGSASKIGNLYYIDIAKTSEMINKKGIVRKNEMEKAIETIKKNKFEEDEKIKYDGRR